MEEFIKQVSEIIRIAGTGVIFSYCFKAAQEVAFEKMIKTSALILCVAPAMRGLVILSQSKFVEGTSKCAYYFAQIINFLT